MASELGSMKVTEQVDAIWVLGANPIKKLVVPRVVATVLILPFLTVMADCVGIIGGMIVARIELGQTMHFFLNSVFTTMHFEDFLTGIGKSVFFVVFISVIGCYNGLTAKGGADGVGQATTNTVVAASISILISNFFLTKLFLIIW